MREGNSSIEEIEKKWSTLIQKLESDFGHLPDIQAVMFLIGLQELGKGYIKANKDQKMEIFHIATCTLLEPYGFYSFVGFDEDGYPHWETKEPLPSLSSGQQLLLFKTAIIDYFSKIYA